MWITKFLPDSEALAITVIGRRAVCYYRGYMLRLIMLACVSFATAFAQADPPAAVPHESTIEKIMGVVGPSEPSYLTEKKRFHLYVLSTVGPVPLIGEAVGAGFNQWENSPKEW